MKVNNACLADWTLSSDDAVFVAHARLEAEWAAEYDALAAELAAAAETRNENSLSAHDMNAGKYSKNCDEEGFNIIETDDLQ